MKTRRNEYVGTSLHHVIVLVAIKDDVSVIAWYVSVSSKYLIISTIFNVNFVPFILHTVATRIGIY